MLVVAAAAAYEMPELYTAQVPLNPRDPAARDEAYGAALEQILVRITGAPEAAESPLLDELFPNPARYVLRYRPGEENSLVVTLDGAAIEAVLRRAGQSVWPADRPMTLVWLAVDWGQGEREIIAADDAARPPAAARSIDRNRLLRERVLETANRRGLPVTFPLLDTEDLAAVNFSDIWGGFDATLMAASERYSANGVLIGRVRPAGGQTSRWTYHLGGDVAEYSGTPEVVINRIADSLAAEYAFSGNAPVETVNLTISGIRSLSDYGAVQQAMREIDQVERFTVDTVAGDRIRYTVYVYGGADRLGRALERSGKFRPREGLTMYPREEGAFPGFDALDYVYEP